MLGPLYPQPSSQVAFTPDIIYDESTPANERNRNGNIWLHLEESVCNTATASNVDKLKFLLPVQGPTTSCLREG